MGNKVTSTSNSRIVDNKLAVILEEINISLKEAETQEREEILVRFNNIMSKFYKTLSSPVLNLKDFYAGRMPEHTEINRMLFETSQDLDVIFREINSLQRFMVLNFNNLNSTSSSIRGRIRKVASEIADYRLYATDTLGGALYFGDTFNNTDKVDYTDDLYTESKCSVDLFSGVATLPRDEGKTAEYAIEKISIGDISNGVLGNNNELGALKRDRLTALADNSPDTWVEYELTSREPTNTPLIMEIEVKVDNSAPINTIDLSTMAFGSKKYPKLTKLEVSPEGVTYTSVIDEVVGSRGDVSALGYISLAPVAGGVSESTRFYFNPRLARYVKMTFQQDESYIVRGAAGNIYRKAIGIRDIKIIGQAFKPLGELISIPFSGTSEIKKVTLKSNQVDQLNLTEMSHYISVDNGQKWNEIQSIEEVSNDASEILNFNLEGVDSIDTDQPVQSIRYKALMKRSAEGFGTKAAVVKRETPTSEFLTISPPAKTITLSEKPILNSVSIHNTAYGSVGGRSTFYISNQQFKERNNRLYVYLPMRPFSRNSIQEDQEVVTIQGEIWSRTSSLATAGSNDRVYEFDYINNIMIFGDNLNGVRPTSAIEFYLLPERGLLETGSSTYIKTAFSNDGVKETTKVYRFTGEKTKENISLSRTGTVHSTGEKRLTSLTVVSDPANVMTNEKTYFNGYEELGISGDYSVDYVNGIIYTYDPAPRSGDTLVSITHKKVTELSGISFDEAGNILLSDTISTERKTTSIDITANTNVIELGQKTIRPRSVQFSTLQQYLKTEVPYKTDGSMFNIPLTPAELDGYYSIDYRNGRIFTYTQIPSGEKLFLQYEWTEIYVEYNIALEIFKTDYEININNNTINFTDAYVIKTFSDSLVELSSRTLFKVSYKYAEEFEQNPKKLEPFYSPMMLDYRLAVLDKERL
jgi:hypothetical protein